MKKFLTAVFLTGISIILIGCSSTPTPKGIFYTNTKGPFYATSNEKGEKSGKSTAIGVFGLLAWGDASTETAAKNAGITKIHHADYEDTMYFLGFFSRYTIVVYGE